MILGNTVRDSGFIIESLTDVSKLTTDQIDESDLVILDLMGA
jgi:chemotaxis signal transduction protein